VSEARRAIHVRTGQQGTVRAVEAWLARSRIETVCYDDVYAACVHLVQRCEDVPDLVLIGGDWLSADEFRIVSYVRQTWPPAGIVVYGAAADLPLFDFLPLTQTCRGETALARLLEGTPADTLRRLRGQLPLWPSATRDGAAAPDSAGAPDPPGAPIERPPAPEEWRIDAEPSPSVDAPE